MRPLVTLIGVLLICLGIFGFIYKYYPYKTEENVAKLGPLQVNVEHRNYVYFPPLLSGLAVIAGIVLVTVGRKKS